MIGTPIGNLGDITLRAIETLSQVETLYCEDSRVSARLINHLLDKGLLHKKPRYVPYNEFNEERVWSELVREVSGGQQVGLVSDAGMPTLSDPGYRAVRGVLDAGARVVVVPGPTALTTALPYSGVGGEIALYLGFLPKTSGKAERILLGARELCDKIPSARIVLYVAPHRLLKDLAMVERVMGNIRAVLLRELTKLFEERVEGTVRELRDQYTAKKIRGELVLIVSKQGVAGHPGGLGETENFENSGADIT